MLLKAWPAYATATQRASSEYCLQSLREMRVSYQLVFIPEPMKIKCLDLKYLELGKVKLEVKKKKELIQI